MLGKWLSHKEYQKNVVSEFSDLARLNPHALLEYQNDISRVFILNLDLLKPIIEPLYSTTGRPSNLQPEIFRSYTLMNSLGFTIDNWIVKLQNNNVLRILIGGTIPRGTLQWKNKMKERTAAERVNNRILNDYGIENSKARGKKRISFLTTIAVFNIHLDVQLKLLKVKCLFDFMKTFNIQAVA